ncbi:MAG TPA: hypothetical protein VN660_01410 [Steroidobacteraceae bacterium]|nr:hypothetical protein [Steroidobacteraceae bacterium]
MKEAELAPTSLPAWSLAYDLWREGDVAGAHRVAEKVLQASPTDFEMLLICLGYYVRSRDSEKTYSFAERLVAAKSTAHTLLALYDSLWIFLWPLELSGFGRRLRKRATFCDRWVLWAKNYVSSHPQLSVGERARGDDPPIDIPAGEIEETRPQRGKWSATRIILVILVIALLLYLMEQLARHGFVQRGQSFAA